MAEKMEAKKGRKMVACWAEKMAVTMVVERGKWKVGQKVD